MTFAGDIRGQLQDQCSIFTINGLPCLQFDRLTDRTYTKTSVAYDASKPRLDGSTDRLYPKTSLDVPLSAV